MKSNRGDRTGRTVRSEHTLRTDRSERIAGRSRSGRGLADRFSNAQRTTTTSYIPLDASATATSAPGTDRQVKAGVASSSTQPQRARDTKALAASAGDSSRETTRSPVRTSADKSGGRKPDSRPGAKGPGKEGAKGVGKGTGKGVGKGSVKVSANIRAVRPLQVASLLEDIFQWRHPADQCVSYYFRQHRHLGGRDRAEIAQAVFDVLRHLRRYRRDAQSGPGPLNLCLAWRGLSATLADASETLGADAPMQEWVKRCQQIDEESLPFEVRYSLPDWFAQRILAMPDPQGLAHALLQSASIDLRVNSFKIDRDGALAQVRAMLEQSSRHGFAAQPTPFSDVGIRLKGHPPLQRWALFEQGVLEVQDEGSQLLAKLVDPKRQEMVIDFCAGAGGKTLALGAMMRSTGRLYAFDVSAARLARAKPRFARSGLSNIHPVVIRPEGDDRIRRLAGKAHRVLVDAPCTGLGTLRRNPDLKWRQSADELDRLQIEQAQILEQASLCVRPGGRLVYATCSLLAEENEAQVERFLLNHPEFTLVDARSLLPLELTEGEHSAVDRRGMVRLRPDWHGTDGFFAAVMQRAATGSGENA